MVTEKENFPQFELQMRNGSIQFSIEENQGVSQKKKKKVWGSLLKKLQGEKGQHVSKKGKRALVILT